MGQVSTHKFVESSAYCPVKEGHVTTHFPEYLSP